jgi:uncharacterized membrane protein YukC
MELEQILYASIHDFSSTDALHALIRDGWQIQKVEDSDRNADLIETFKYTLIRVF